MYIIHDANSKTSQNKDQKLQKKTMTYTLT